MAGGNFPEELSADNGSGNEAEAEPKSRKRDEKNKEKSNFADADDYADMIEKGEYVPQ